MFTDLIKSWVQPFGIDVVKFPPLSPLARQLKAFLHMNEINLVIDIGACDGGYCRFLRGPVGYEGQIASFEPTKETFDRLHSAMHSDAKWNGFNLGVSDVVGEGILNTYGERCDFNSLLTMREKDAVNYEVDVSKKGIEKVGLRSIDSLWNEITKDLEKPRVYLKTDTQGHDRAVIRGSEPRLGSILGIQSEIPAIEIYEGMTPMPDMLKYLAGLGYIPIGFHPINQPEVYDGATPEFDVVFKRSH
jgi:FkbM family methyltransferase